jgi:hypothetical protein
MSTLSGVNTAPKLDLVTMVAGGRIRETNGPLDSEQQGSWGSSLVYIQWLLLIYFSINENIGHFQVF